MKVHKTENNDENQALNFKGTKNLGKQLVEWELLGTVKSMVVLLLTFSRDRILSLGLSRGLKFRNAFFLPLLKVTTYNVSGNMTFIILL